MTSKFESWEPFAPSFLFACLDMLQVGAAEEALEVGAAEKALELADAEVAPEVDAHAAYESGGRKKNQ